MSVIEICHLTRQALPGGLFRRLAAAEDLETVDAAQGEIEAAHGELPLAELNLFDRARLRIRGERLERGIDANAAGGPVASALMLLQQLGASGDDD